MAKLSYAELKSFVAGILTDAKVSNPSFVASRDNTAGLLDKIGKIITLDTSYQIDKLNAFDGEYLSFGKTIEEWQEDLIMPQAYDNTGANALAPHRPTYRPAFYSYTIGKKVVATTIDYNDLERAVHFEEQYVSLISMKYKRLEDSMAVYRYELKREMIARFYSLATANADSTLSSVGSSTAFGATRSVNDIVVISSISGISTSYIGRYVVVVAQASADVVKDAIDDGELIKLDLVSELAKPVDTSTGEAFIKSVKSFVEQAQDLSEGNSLNGNSLGATEGLVLIVKQNILPSLEVETWAGAFHQEMVSLPAETIVVKDFGSADDKVYAVLMDRRAMRLHPTFNGTYENLNGEGAFLNIFRHTEDTAWLSRNAFVHFWKES